MDSSMHEALLLSETEEQAEKHYERAITTTQPGTLFSPTPIVVQTDRRESADLAWIIGVLTCCCCNVLLGLGAIYCANEAIDSFNERMFDSGITLRRLSYFFSLLAFVAGILTIYFVVVRFDLGLA
ncbi:uncharacterized protein LOC134232510 [Saccostrea cucullata]|uniref:uncharacterized protein LOC134232510 n=1 Tax=Saccostrea cuccullata TaxID=36930 RepID=UPI002ED263B0